MSAWSNCLSQLKLPHKLEPQYRYVNSDKRSNILVYDPDSGSDIELDVSLAHPLCLDSVKAASREEGVAAMKREEKKEAKYNSELLPEESCPLVIPLVFKHFGCWGKLAVRYLNKLGKSARDEEGRQNETDFKTKWRSILSVTLHGCNAKVVSNKTH